jgi:NAD(P)-dependent dehydrogenase (short-subunit alcohol dehydrogenase family)
MTTTIALITGANKGIGLETARQLGGRGVTVLAGVRDEARGLEAERALRDGGADARFVRLDVTDPKSAQEAADWVDQHYGRLDILVNNAGIARAGGPPSQTNLDAMREVYETNVFGVIIVTNAMLPLLRRAPAARIVNVSSEVGSITSMTDPASPLAQMPASLAYTSSKSALNMITALYAKELRDTPVKVNAANPGYTATTGSVRSPRERKPASTSPPWTPTTPAESSGATCGPPEARATPTARSPGEQFP